MVKLVLISGLSCMLIMILTLVFIAINAVMFAIIFGSIGILLFMLFVVSVIVDLIQH